MSAENPYELKVGDPPLAVHGSYAIHLHSPSGAATLENTHWRDEAPTWQGVINLEGITGNAGVVIELGGFVRLSGNASAKVSLVPIGGRSGGYRS
jgi:hypothetical protein